jgi:PAS domain S-box-containing protein
VRGVIQQIPPGDVLELLGNALDAQVAYLGTDLRYQFANDAYHAWLAKPSLSLRGKAMQDVLSKDAFEQIRPYIQLALSGERSEFEIERRHPTSGLRAVVGRIQPDIQPDGSVHGFLVILRDVTEGRRRQEADAIKKAARLQVEQLIASSEKRFRTMVDQSPLSIQIFEPSGRCIHANFAWNRLWEADPEQLASYNILTDHQFELLLLNTQVERAFKGEVVEIPSFEYDPFLSGIEGRKRWVRALFYPIRTDEDLQEIVLVLQDVTEEIEARNELNATKERLQLIVNTSQDAVITVDAEDMITGWDGQAAHILGWTREEAAGSKLLPLILAPDQRPAQFNFFSQFLRAEDPRALNRRFEIETVHKNGHRFPAEVAISAAKQSGETFFSIFVRDISEQKASQAELQALNALLEQRVEERTEALQRANRELSEFSYSVAHDLRNPLRRLAATAAILSQENADKLTGEAKEHLDEIQGFVQDMSRLIQDHLDFVRFGTAKLSLSQIDFSQLAWSVVRDAEETYPHVKFRVRVLPSIEVSADPDLLRAAVEALVDNAGKFTRKVSNPAIEIGVKKASGKLVFYVRDNGVGFDKRYIDKLFKPFERLHRDDQYAGTGVGLANVKRIVEQHGGTVWAESQEGKGSLFCFTLG